MSDTPASPPWGGGGGGGEGGGSDEGGGCGYGGVWEQDRFLPVANISRIMKKVIPTNDKIAKDAKETVQECVSEFISFITSEVSDKCQREKRKTSNGDDLLWAMATLGFEEYIDPSRFICRSTESPGGGRILEVDDVFAAPFASAASCNCSGRAKPSPRSVESFALSRLKSSMY